MSIEVKVGTKGWRAISRRVYRPNGGDWNKSSGAPLARGNWEPIVVISETSRSWLICREGRLPRDLKDAEKIPKSDPASKGVYFDATEVENIIWWEEHGYLVAQVLSRAPIATRMVVAEALKKARLFDFELPPPPSPDGPYLIERSDTSKLYNFEGVEVGTNGRPVKDLTPQGGDK